MRGLFQKQMRSDARVRFARVMEEAERRASNPIEHPDSAAYVMLAHAVVRYIEALDAARTYGHRSPAALDLGLFEEDTLRAVLGWTPREERD